MDGIGNDGGITSKLNTLLRMGLVSRNNVQRAKYLFQNPEKAMRSPAYRLLMQEILMDVVDRVLNNRQLYAVLRQTISKEPNLTTEGVEGERAKTLLRSGLVKKKNVLAARRALQSPETAIKMSASKVYRDMMIDMMDSMVKKITGSPVLFNAFKQTLGKEKMEESFEVPTQESLDEFFYIEDVQNLMEKNKPTNPSLWAKAKAAAKSKFDVYPSAYANGWAVKWYNEKGGDWKSVSEGKTFFGLRAELDEAAGRDYITKMPQLVIRPKEPTEAEKEAAEDKKRALRAKFKGQKAKKKSVAEAWDEKEIEKLKKSKKEMQDAIEASKEHNTPIKDRKKKLGEGIGVYALGAAAAASMKRQREADKRRAEKRREDEKRARDRDNARQSGEYETEDYAD